MAHTHIYLYVYIYIYIHTHASGTYSIPILSKMTSLFKKHVDLAG